MYGIGFVHCPLYSSAGDYLYWYSLLSVNYFIQACTCVPGSWAVPVQLPLLFFLLAILLHFSHVFS